MNNKAITESNITVSELTRLLSSRVEFSTIANQLLSFPPYDNNRGEGSRGIFRSTFTDDSDYSLNEFNYNLSRVSTVSRFVMTTKKNYLNNVHFNDWKGDNDFSFLSNTNNLYDNVMKTSKPITALTLLFPRYNCI